MATKKTYTVMKDGEEIEKLSTLVAARKLADAEGAEVFCDGECVYKGAAQDAPETVIVHADPVVAEKPKQPEVTEPATVRYRLKALMNVRKKPSLDADILSTKPESTVVRVLAVENGWLYLIDGSFILFEDGKVHQPVFEKHHRLPEVSEAFEGAWRDGVL